LLRVDTRSPDPASQAPTPAFIGLGGGRRALWHALAVVLAVAVTWLIFTAYRQPGFILDVASLRLC
jgi:hypothetical protein